jgi:hypothetical protein
MKLAVRSNDVQSHGVESESEFTVDVNAKLFRTLTTTLYSDRPLAAVRELSTNAYDAHIEAGTPDRAFEWKIPSHFDPVFGIRDYGPGLSHHDCMELYVTFFRSTKDDSNDQVGALGLGSKSPFAYTDSFTVISRHKGVKNTYTCFIGKAGLPAISHFGSEDTDEESGLEVTFPVRTDDIDDFIRAATTVIYGFDVEPIMTGTVIVKEDREILFSGHGWKVVRSVDNSSRHMNPLARQGCVLYRIDADAIPNITEAQRGLLSGSGLVIDFEIGQLDIAASREGLGYDDATCKNITTRLEQIIDEISTAYIEQIEECDNYWEACCVYNKIMGQFRVSSYTQDAITKKVRWRNLPVRRNIDINTTKLVGVRHSHSSAYEFKRRDVARWKLDSEITRLEATNNLLFFVQHVKPGDKGVVAPALRLKAYVDSLGYNPSVMWIRADTTSIAYKRFLIQCGRPNVINIADLERPPVQSSTTGRRPVVKIRRLTSGGAWEEADHDPANGGVYVDLLRGVPCTPKDVKNTFAHSNSSLVLNTLKLLREVGILDDDTEVFGIPGTYRTIPEKNDGWENLFDIARVAVKLNYSEDVCEAAADSKELYYHRDRVFDFFRDAIEEYGDWLTTEGPAKELHDLLIEAKDHYEDNKIQELFKQLATVFGSETPAEKIKKREDREKTLAPYAEAVRKHYPLTGAVFYSDYVSVNQEHVKAFMDYITMIDNQASFVQTS